MSTIAPPRSDAGIQRWAALAGAAYVVLFLVGVILTYSGAVDTSAAPAKVIAYYSDSGHRDRVNFGWLIAGLGVFFFLWFLSALRQAVRRLEAEDGFLTGPDDDRRCRLRDADARRAGGRDRHPDDE